MNKIFLAALLFTSLASADFDEVPQDPKHDAELLNTEYGKEVYRHITEDLIGVFNSFDSENGGKVVEFHLGGRWGKAYLYQDKESGKWKVYRTTY